MEWPEETIQQLRNLWDEGLSTAAIAMRLGVTKNAVVGKAHRLDLPGRPSPIRREGDPRPRAPRAPPRPRDTLPLLDCLRGATSGPEPRKPYVPRIIHPEAKVERPVAVKTGPLIACCWPLGDPKAKDFRFCSDPSEPGRPYCTKHVELAYVKLRDLRDDAA